MSGRSGNKIAAFFNSKLLNNLAKHTALLAKTLEHRTFGQKHFEGTKKILKALAENVPEVVSMGLIQSQSKGSIEYLWFSIAYIMAKEEDPDIHTIEQYEFSMKNHRDRKMSDMQIMTRRYPLQIQAPHTFFRFIQRSGEALSYSTPEFDELCGMSVLMAIAHKNLHTGDLMRLAENANGRDMEYPAVLPFKNGLMLGVIKWALDKSLDEYTLYFASEKMVDENDKVVHAGTLQLSPINNPFCEFFVKTSISHMEFLGRQPQLFDQLKQCFYGTPERKDLLRTINRTYIGRDVKSERTPKMALASAMITELVQIMQGPAWQEHAQRRTPRPPMN